MQSKIEQAFISFRIGVTQWMPDRRFRELLRWFTKYSGVTDEIAFFTSETHPPLPLSVIEERAVILKERMIAIRKMGLRAGINILASIGHHEENLPHSLTGDFAFMTGIEGTVCRGSLCPNDERTRAYVRRLYELVVAAQPDFIWIDDDVRLGHGGFQGCFCDTCLRIFRDASGKNYTRESLRNAFDKGPIGQKIEIRRTWLQHNRGTIARLLRLIEETVHAVDSDMPLGFMTGDRPYEGNDFAAWADILAGNGGTPVLWRPGGGTYEDRSLRWIIDKSWCVGLQSSLLPPTVLSIQSEIENFPYQRLKKAAYSTALEAASHIAAGCTGAAFNVLSMYDEPLDEYAPLMARLRDTRPFLDLLAKTCGRSHAQGLYFGWNNDLWIVNHLSNGPWMKDKSSCDQWWTEGGSSYDQWCIENAGEILELGISRSYVPETASATALSGKIVPGLRDDEILRALSSGVYMDAEALQCLNERGYGELTGFGVERWVKEDCLESFTDDPLNGRFAGCKRDGRQSFWKVPAAVLTPTATSSRILAKAVDYAGQEIGPCCAGVFENARGGRVCVTGYYPWLFLQNLSKSTQMKAVLRWLSRDTLPGYIESFHKIVLWIRGSEDKGRSVVLINASMDTATGLTLMLRTAKKDLVVFNMKNKEYALSAVGKDGPYLRFQLPPLKPWEMMLAVIP